MKFIEQEFNNVKISDFQQIMDEVKAGIQYAFQTKNQWTVCVSGTGNKILKRWKRKINYKI